MVREQRIVEEKGRVDNEELAGFVHAKLALSEEKITIIFMQATNFLNSLEVEVIRIRKRINN